MALPTNDKMIGDLGHTEDHNAIVNEIVFIKENYFSASSTNIFLPEYLRSDTASSVYLTQEDATATYLPISASATISLVGYLTEESASAIYLSKIGASEIYLPISASATLSPEGYLTASAAAAIYAPINSPSFTGVPIGPTASAGNNTNQLATTQFVSEAILAVQTGSSVDLSAYLRIDTASSIYLTQIDAENTYLPISASANFTGSASVDLSDYLTISVASATYLPISASTSFLTENSVIDCGGP
jgi:hypothetical protein